MKNIITMLFILVFSLLTACAYETTDCGKIKDCEYTVVKTEEIPEELQSILEEKKKEPFQLTYTDQGNLYIAQGYGMQVGGGYSICVESLYETKDSIVLKANLLGPQEVTKAKGKTYPYIVIKMEDIEKEINFDSTSSAEQKNKTKSLWLHAGKRQIGFIEDTTLQK